MHLELLNSPWFRPAVFISCYSFFAMYEVFYPRRKLSASKKKRWTGNLSLGFFNSIFVKLSFPFTLATVASVASDWKVGLLNLVELSAIVELVLAIILLDLFIYIQHVATHKISFLWRLHRVHHVDVDLDVSSGLRFHTLEIGISFLYKILLVFLLGPTVEAIIIFEVLLNAMAMFNHSNIKISQRLDSILRLVVVTPDMHRIHHSTDIKEHNTNFGFNLSWWDFLFKTYQKTPSLGQINMQIGLAYFRELKYTAFTSLIKMPFIKINLSNKK